MMMSNKYINITKFTITVICPVEKREIHFDISLLDNGGWLVCDRRLASGSGTIYGDLEGAVESVLSLEPRGEIL
tara:strand:- start:56 stop:277 length:222 start_codon:yes stop_codon:yes gene_type:complete